MRTWLLRNKKGEYRTIVGNLLCFDTEAAANDGVKRANDYFGEDYDYKPVLVEIVEVTNA